MEITATSIVEKVREWDGTDTCRGWRRPPKCRRQWSKQWQGQGEEVERGRDGLTVSGRIWRICMWSRRMLSTGVSGERGFGPQSHARRVRETLVPWPPPPHTQSFIQVLSATSKRDKTLVGEHVKINNAQSPAFYTLQLYKKGVRDIARRREIV